MVWLRAIALAWSARWSKNEESSSVTAAHVELADGRYKTHCTEKDCQCYTGCRFLADLLNNPAEALEEWFGYKSPFAINFRVKLPDDLVDEVVKAHPKLKEKWAWPEISWHPDTFKTAKEEGQQEIDELGKWGVFMPATHIKIGLPNKQMKFDVAIAISDFISSGPVYLFTCC
jgi:hypothetical protein